MKSPHDDATYLAALDAALGANPERWPAWTIAAAKHLGNAIAIGDLPEQMDKITIALAPLKADFDRDARNRKAKV